HALKHSKGHVPLQLLAGDSMRNQIEIQGINRRLVLSLTIAVYEHERDGRLRIIKSNLSRPCGVAQIENGPAQGGQDARLQKWWWIQRIACPQFRAESVRNRQRNVRLFSLDRTATKGGVHLLPAFIEIKVAHMPLDPGER